MIGVFDSGSGGLTVLREIVAKAPSLDVVYFADIKNVPYGLKTQAELQTLTAEAIGLLRKQGAHGIVSACNSVSATILESLANTYSIDRIDLVEMVGPTTKALEQFSDKRIVVLGTEATISSGIYQKAAEILGYRIKGVALRDLAHGIESGYAHNQLKAIIESSLHDIRTLDPEIIVLCCTQFPLARHIFEEIFEECGMDVVVINPAEFVAEKVARTFTEVEQGILSFFVSKDSMYFRDTVKEFFPMYKDNIHVVEQ